MMNKENVFKLISSHYEDHFSTLVKSVTRIVGNTHDAEDVVQNAYTWCLHNWGKYDPDRGSIALWFISPLRHAIRDKRRDQHTHGITDTPMEFYMRSIAL